ncbi:MAG: hypothetical protein LBE82_10655 [Chitinophagaceae bacterium]|jgi:phenylalanine-4-hydroxylase|nr:hypothetical protein [Chitinophagaceae bacterium]
MSKIKKIKSINDCLKQETGFQICRDEEGKEICFSNADFEMVCDVVPIDKCVFNKVKGERKCDFLFLFDRNKQRYRQVLKRKSSQAYYVELKGIDLTDACEQLLNSIEKTRHEITGYDINAVVVSSRKFVPKNDNNKFLREIMTIIKKNVTFNLTPHNIQF